ncbi:MAG: hypothetical protein S4CHLAM6_07170 [Chlamydiae bacterium]|nr:hypothetical protein [Chlamydiota bacterium]
MSVQPRKFYQFFFILFMLSFVSIGCTGQSLLSAKDQDQPNWQQEVHELDEKIAVLKRWQEGYKMTAEQAQFKADRLQFEENQLLDSKRLWKVAENATQKAQDLQVIIGKLEDQRNEILKKHNQPIPKN